jgi:hypothetical protein
MRIPVRRIRRGESDGRTVGCAGENHAAAGESGADASDSPACPGEGAGPQGEKAWSGSVPKPELLLQDLLESAGAQWGCLVMPSGRAWAVVAEFGETVREEGRTGVPPKKKRSLREAGNLLSLLIVKNALDTGETVVLDSRRRRGDSAVGEGRGGSAAPARTCKGPRRQPVRSGRYGHPGGGGCLAAQDIGT